MYPLQTRTRFVYKTIYMTAYIYILALLIKKFTKLFIKSTLKILHDLKKCKLLSPFLKSENILLVK